MSKTKKGNKSKRPAARVENPPPVFPGKTASPWASWVPSQAAFRELIEVIATAFILAFLFRTFEAEAFVIPTGSMAETLMGRHKDVTCPMCGYPYQVSSSEEVESETGTLALDHRGNPKKVVGGTCPMCHYEMPMQSDREKSYSGDRIVVNKFAYQFSDPQRFDVAVFRCPEGARTNYVKRITGLPGETIRIQNGDLFVKRRGENDFQIARKPPSKALAMLRTVYDSDRAEIKKLLARGWPARWWAEDASGGWTIVDNDRSFSADGKSPGQTWLRYRHVVPNPGVWEQLDRPGPLPPTMIPKKPRLISDDCAYNSTVLWQQREGRRAGLGWEDNGLGLHWVGDLAVGCALDVRRGEGAVLFELVEGGRAARCRLDLATGQATLSISGLEEFVSSAQTTVKGAGSHDILFANTDDQLRLWVDGRLVSFDRPTTYPPLGNNSPTEADLAPVGIASHGADVRVHRLRVLRDTYYIADRASRGEGTVSDFERPSDLFITFDPLRIAEVLSQPALYAGAPRNGVEFELEDDQFLALGDNSARSKDSRLWSGQYYVDRNLLIGQALFIYWPHSWDKIPGTEIPFPFFPNFAKMGFVR